MMFTKEFCVGRRALTSKCILPRMHQGQQFTSCHSHVVASFANSLYMPFRSFYEEVKEYEEQLCIKSRTKRKMKNWMLDNDDTNEKSEQTKSRANINNNSRNTNNDDSNSNKDVNEAAKPTLQRWLHLSDRAILISFVLSFVVVLVLQLYMFNPPEISKPDDEHEKDVK